MNSDEEMVDSINATAKELEDEMAALKNVKVERLLKKKRPLTAKELIAGKRDSLSVLQDLVKAYNAGAYNAVPGLPKNGHGKNK